MRAGWLRAADLELRHYHRKECDRDQGKDAGYQRPSGGVANPVHTRGLPPRATSLSDAMESGARLRACHVLCNRDAHALSRTDHRRAPPPVGPVPGPPSLNHGREQRALGAGRHRLPAAGLPDGGLPRRRRGPARCRLRQRRGGLGPHAPARRGGGVAGKPGASARHRSARACLGRRPERGGAHPAQPTGPAADRRRPGGRRLHHGPEGARQPHVGRRGASAPTGRRVRGPTACCRPESYVLRRLGSRLPAVPPGRAIHRDRLAECEWCLPDSSARSTARRRPPS